MPKGFSDEEKQLIRQRLLEQGYKQFSNYGLKKTNIEELAEAAGISKGAFYIFYESKETLFMDVIELAEERFRRDILAMVAQPGPTPRARLFNILKESFTLVMHMPIFQFLMGIDFDLLFRRVPAEKLQEHLASDRVFIEELIKSCQEAGIPICLSVEQISEVLYQLVMMTIHQADFGAGGLPGTPDVMLELVAAYCLGEVEIQVANAAPVPSPINEGLQK